MKYEDGKISFSLISSTFHRKNGIKHVYTKDEIDYFSLYNIECDKLLLLPIDFVEGMKQVSFRIPFIER